MTEEYGVSWLICVFFIIISALLNLLDVTFNGTTRHAFHWNEFLVNPSSRNTLVHTM
jgi:hypothetical protein